MQPMKAARKKPSGGQRGNSNALRHGFYSRQFQELELKDLDQIVKGGMDDEVAMLRIAIRRVFEHFTEAAESAESPMVKNLIMAQSLSTLGIATTRLAHMLRTKKFLDGGSDDPLEDLITRVLNEVQG